MWKESENCHLTDCGSEYCGEMKQNAQNYHTCSVGIISFTGTTESMPLFQTVTEHE